MTTAVNIGFIGIGNMGYRMAANIRKKMAASAVLYIYDLSVMECQRFIHEFGALGRVERAASTKELAQCSSVLLSMVPMDHHARTVYLDPEAGVIAATPDRNRLVLECSTLSVSATQDIGREIIKAGVAQYVDTPVSGGVQGAEAGTLSFFCGSTGPALGQGDAVSETISTILGYMGGAERINFCGKLGSGLTCKMVNNYIALSNIVVASEGLAFGLRHGLGVETMRKCIQGSSGDSWVMRNSPPAPGMVASSASSKGFRPGFATQLCIKDINLAIQAARSVGIATNMGETAITRYKQAENDARTSGLDCTSIWLHINEEVEAFAN